MNNTDPFAAILILGVLIFIYFIPTVVAAARNHHNYGAIFVTNLLLGWTFLGWVAALIWSFTVVKSAGKYADVYGENTLGNSKVCPFCAETIKYDAKVCRFCNRDLEEHGPPNSDA